MLKGALHIHSTFSDGEFTLAEIRQVFLAAGCQFACVTDHADHFAGDPAKLAAYVAVCQALSDDRFQFIAGLEYTCEDRMHVLGYGATAMIDSTDPELVISGIRAQGALAVIAHPRDTAFPAIEAFRATPHGLEVWNTKYDSRYAPRPATFALLQRIRQRRGAVHAFYGQDLHWKRQYRGMFTMVACTIPTRAAVLAALSDGRYHGLKDRDVLPANGILSHATLAAYGRIHERSQRGRLWLRALKKWGEAFGVGVPVSVKAQLRRIF